MIFSIEDHIEMIKSGQKTQTRRQSNFFKVNKTYSIQPGRGKPGIAEGRIRITNKKSESRLNKISLSDAWDEGMYMQLEFERLYNDLYPGWQLRYVYTFVYVPIQVYRKEKLIND
ncbi:MAG: hypothetical protein ACW99F_03835 [Candidatus Hodarchaeales archaeon]|jgi:hypothetical protein